MRTSAIVVDISFPSASSAAFAYAETGPFRESVLCLLETFG